MPIASIPKSEPIVKPAVPEKTFSHLDLDKLVIRRHRNKYSVSGSFSAYDETSDELSEDIKVTFSVEDFVEATKNRLTLRSAAVTFVKELAAAVQQAKSE